MKQKYTIYLSNTSKIVLTGNFNTKQNIINKITKLLESKQFALFDTDTDMVFVNPIKIVSIHVSNITNGNFKSEPTKSNKNETPVDESEISDLEFDGSEEDFSDDNFDESNIDDAINEAFDKMDLTELDEISELNNLTTGETSIQEADTLLNDEDDDEIVEVLLDCSNGI